MGAGGIVTADGALSIGTGLIAVLASNWDDFPRWVRRALALGPLAATQAVSGWVLGRGAAAKTWHREAAALGQTLAVGAAISLVSQIYNLPGKWTDVVSRWCVVAVPLAWVLRSWPSGRDGSRCSRSRRWRSGSSRSSFRASRGPRGSGLA